MTKNNKTPHCRVMNIEAQQLRIHPLAQRNLVPSRLKAIRNALDLDAIGTVHVVKYTINGITAYWVIDGQHRLIALLEEGFGEWEIEAVLHEDVTDDRRASELFLRLNDRSPVSPMDKFRNEVTAGNNVAVAVTKLADSRGLTISNHPAHASLRCPALLKSCYRLDDGVSLTLALDTIIAAWGKQPAALEGKLVEGVSLLFHEHKESISIPTLVKKMAKFSGGPSNVLGDAKGIMGFNKTTLSRAIADVLVNAYNTGRSSGRLGKAAA